MVKTCKSNVQNCQSYEVWLLAHLNLCEGFCHQLYFRTHPFLEFVLRKDCGVCPPRGTQTIPLMRAGVPLATSGYFHRIETNFRKERHDFPRTPTPKLVWVKDASTLKTLTLTHKLSFSPSAHKQGLLIRKKTKTRIHRFNQGLHKRSRTHRLNLRPIIKAHG